MRGIMDIILDNNARLDVRNVRRMLIVYSDNEFYLGDSCIIFHRLGLCSRFFGNDVRADLSFVNKDYFNRYKDLSRNNPLFNEIICKDFSQVDCTGYDVLLFIAYDEQPFVEVLEATFVNREQAPSFAVFSFSKAVFHLRENIEQPVFPFFEDLFRYAATYITDQPYELYVSPQEKEWGNKWLEENGISKGDDVYIIADNTSKRKKLLRLEVYHTILMHLLSKENTMILIFDETDIGKDQFYRHWLKGKHIHRFVFATSLSLREALCITSSDHVKMVFGPCTGLLHCASGIYNNLLKNGLPPSKVPAIITYTGAWDANYWWRNSPLVDCLLLRNVNGKKGMCLLSQLSENEKQDWESRLNCTEYTSEMMIEFIDGRLSGKGKFAETSSYATA